MARVRTFIAVALTERIRQACLELKRELAPIAGPVRWVEEENFHVTLLFLGEVEELDLVAICRVVGKQSAKRGPFRLTVQGLGCFPTPRRPKVLWAGIEEGADELRDLHASIEKTLLEIGCYRREDRAYSPHLTLGRIASKEEEPKDEAQGTGEKEEAFSWPQVVGDHADWLAGYCEIAEILVMTSEHHRGKSVYSIVSRAPLTGKEKSSPRPPKP